MPDHFYQAYIWSIKSFTMGNSTAGVMAGNGIDRYLMNLNQKQLYGGQAHAEGTPGGDACFCLWPLEETFPEEKRKEIGFRSIDESLDWLKELNKNKVGCSNSFCKVTVKPTPQGSIPGVW